MIRNYLKITWRNIIGQRSASVINILGLAMGISACLMIWMDCQLRVYL